MKYFVSLFIALALVATVNAADHKAQSLVGAGLDMPDNTTSNLASGVFSDVGLWANPDGSAPSVRVLISLVGTNANATNTFTLTMKPVVDGTTVSTVDNTTNTITAVLKATGTTRVTDSILVPSSAIAGAKALRLVTVATDNKSTSGRTTLTAKVCGFVP